MKALHNVYVIAITGVVMVMLSVLLNIRDLVLEKNLVISGQQATIASYKENLTSCLKEHKMQPQDEFTGE